MDRDWEDGDFADVDGDGHDATIVGGDDCDDSDPQINPDIAEDYLNEIDDDCDGVVDDEDGDGYTITADGDCNDTDPTIHPDADETCNYLDDNCNGTVDEGVETTYYQDADGDGFGDPEVTEDDCTAPSGYVEDDTDCDDNEPLANPGLTEICNDQIDNDCDGTDNGCGLSGDITLSSADAKLIGEAAGDWAGWSVSGAGDVDGDGMDDLLVGALDNDEGGSGAGATPFFF